MKKLFFCIFVVCVGAYLYGKENLNTLTKEKVDGLLVAMGTTREAVTEFSIPDGFTIIGDYAFEGCRQLKKLELHSGITTIGDIAFGKTAIPELILPSSVTSIGNYAFGKSAISTLTILSKTPPKLKSDRDAFYNGNINKPLSIYVLDESLEIYKATWRNQGYIQIQPISTKNQTLSVSPKEISSTTSEADKQDMRFLVILILSIVLLIYSIKRVKKNVKAKRAEIAEVGIRMSALDEGKLPIENSENIILSKDEVCHFHKSVIYIKVKERVIGYKGGGSGVSFKIAKGINIHTGSGNKKAIRERVSEEEKGILAITNKRIIGNAFNISFDKKISTLTSVESSSDMVLLQFGKIQYYFRTLEAPYIDKIIKLLANGSNRE